MGGVEVISVLEEKEKDVQSPDVHSHRNQLIQTGWLAKKAQHNELGGRPSVLYRNMKPRLAQAPDSELLLFCHKHFPVSN